MGLMRRRQRAKAGERKRRIANVAGLETAEDAASSPRVRYAKHAEISVCS